MNVSEAIKLLAPYHKATLVCTVASDKLINGQLSTGSRDCPFIDVIDSMVSADDIYDAIIDHESRVDTVPIPYFNYSQSFCPTDNLHFLAG